MSQPTVNRVTMSIVNEIWKDVVGLEGCYQVSSLGRVRSCDRVTSHGHKRKGGLLRVHLGRGYLRVPLCNLGKEFTVSVHKLVAEAFLGDRPDGWQINHIDGNKANNCFLNLEYVTPQENMDHAVANGLLNPCRGELSGQSVLTSSEVLQIRKLLLQKLTSASIARSFGVSRTTIDNIKHGKVWSHIH